MYTKHISFVIYTQQRKDVEHKAITYNNSGALVFTYGTIGPGEKWYLYPYGNTHTPTRFSFLKSTIKGKTLCFKIKEI